LLRGIEGEVLDAMAGCKNYIFVKGNNPIIIRITKTPTILLGSVHYK